MITRSNTITDYAFCHIATGKMYDLVIRPRYDRAVNIYAEVWQLNRNLIFATKVEGADRFLVGNVSTAQQELNTAAAEAMNTLASQL